jgi:hypothetical protein
VQMGTEQPFGVSGASDGPEDEGLVVIVLSVVTHNRKLACILLSHKNRMLFLFFNAQHLK